MLNRVGMLTNAGPCWGYPHIIQLPVEGSHGVTFALLCYVASVSSVVFGFYSDGLSAVDLETKQEKWSELRSGVYWLGLLFVIGSIVLKLTLDDVKMDGRDI